LVNGLPQEIGHVEGSLDSGAFEIQKAMRPVVALNVTDVEHGVTHVGLVIAGGIPKLVENIGVATVGGVIDCHPFMSDDRLRFHSNRNWLRTSAKSKLAACGLCPSR
jgi:hypothetical protein